MEKKLAFGFPGIYQHHHQLDHLDPSNHWIMGTLVSDGIGTSLLVVHGTQDGTSVGVRPQD